MSMPSTPCNPGPELLETCAGTHKQRARGLQPRSGNCLLILEKLHIRHEVRLSDGCSCSQEQASGFHERDLLWVRAAATADFNALPALENLREPIWSDFQCVGRGSEGNSSIG